LIKVASAQIKIRTRLKHGD